MVTFGSLFSGIGGIDLGLERAGMKCEWQVEIDEYCNKVLKKHWPKVSRYRDIKTLGKKDLKGVDLICGGFPCQPFSISGQRRGKEDDRFLWPEMLRILRELNPRYVLAENVPGISPYLDEILRSLEIEGYKPFTLEMSAPSFGAPHRRGRIFILAYSNSQRCQNSSQRYNPLRFSNCLSSSERWPRFCKSRVFRTPNGIPSRVDRLRTLGNAVIPQIAEWLGKGIIEHARTLQN